MTEKISFHVIPYQAKTDVLVFEGNVVIEQENEHSDDKDTVLIAAENVDALIDALKQAKEHALKFEHG